MGLGNHGPGSPFRRRRGAFTPEGDMLEGRLLLTGTLDLATVQSASLGTEMIGPAPATGLTTGPGAGYTVTDVGNVTGSGYDSFVIAATGQTVPSTNPATFGSGGGAVYLVFGSKQVNISNAVDYLGLTAGNRAGDLAQLGTLGTNSLGQINPTVTQPTNGTTTYGFNFDGLTFVTGLNTTTGLGTNSALGFSVAALGDINGDGYDDFAIGAPNDAGGGRAFIIYGGPALATQAVTGKTIDLEPTAGTISTTTPTKLISLSLPTTGASATNEVGYSVGALGNYFNYNTAVKDVAVGVPGFNGNAGAVYALSGTYLNALASGTNVNLATVGTTASEGIIYTGILANDRTGSSVTTAGDFDGAKSGNVAVDDLLIGAPGANSGAGTVYLVYGTQTYAPNQLLGTTQSLSTLGMVPTTTPLFNPLSGVVFNAANAGSRFGFTVASAGDYNGDGAGDIIVGAPGTGPGATSSGSVATGYAAIIYGRTGTSANPRINGIFPITPNTTSTSFSSLYYVGENPGDAAGYSVSSVGDISGEGINGVLVGAPGFDGGLGTAYVIPGNYSLTGTQSLGAVSTSASIAGTQLLVSSSFPGTTPYLGTSVSGRPLFGVTQAHTVDSDLIPDVFVGAPGFSLTNPANGTTDARPQAGAGFYLSGASLGVGIPNNVLLTTAGVNSNNPTGTYTLTANGSATFYIFSAAATATLPAFDPVTDLTSPVTLVINGVTFTNVALTDGKDSTGADDVSFVLSAAQVQMLGLVSGSTVAISIRGTTTAGTVFVAKAASAAVTAGGGGGSGGGGGGVVGPSAATILAPPIFTGIDYGLPYPPVSSLEHLTSYQPIPVTLAYQQFLPQPGFLAREEVYHHPSKDKGAHQYAAATLLNVTAIKGSESRYLKVHTYSHTVLSKSKFTYGKSITFTHKVKVIPRSEQTETFSA